ncbi:Ig-like domain-containing protein [Ancylomarina salipaludis]|uniref:Ig-like domain-containing protein n=1 Tax=Ancylomarina salipaludis TaxID=2501299 RepID=A0A4Q1JKB4_9BACT|nr:Ig-like domain-containing protein [Ancylomarina salipaludis]RXQ92188.1 Ig-like domain-containing protein [Ancylomarina salipaludis]
MQMRIFRVVVLALLVSFFSSCEKEGGAERLMAEELTLSDTAVKLEKIGETYQLYAIVKPENADNKSVKWSSDARDIMSVSSSGLVTVKAMGSATITATLISNPDISASCELSLIADELVGIWKSKGADEMIIQFNGLANPEEGRFTYDEFITYCEEGLAAATTEEEKADFTANIAYAEQCKLIYGIGYSLEIKEQNELKVILGKEGVYCTDCSWKSMELNKYYIDFTENWNSKRVRNSILTLSEDKNKAVLDLSPDPAVSHTWYISLERVE